MRDVTAVGLKSGISACLFDLDGVLTPTAKVHAQAWKKVFDEYLQARAASEGEPFRPFDEVNDYDTYVDGKPREDGVRSFLASRHIDLPEGSEVDSAEDESVHGLGNRKDQAFVDLIRKNGVEPYDGSLRYVHAARHVGLRLAVVTSSRHCTEVLKAAGMSDLFDAQIDGNFARAAGLKGKPAPDTYLEAAKLLRKTAANSAVYEDSLAGVEAGRAGGFGIVIGVDRAGQSAALYKNGANVVVTDLSQLLAPQ